MNWKRFIPFFRSSNAPGKAIIDREYIENTINASPIPIVTVAIMVWAVASVLLLLCENQQRELTAWKAGQKAPFSVWARTSFSYTDSAATGILKQEALQNAPRIFRLSEEKNNELRRNLDDFFSTVASDPDSGTSHHRNGAGARFALQFQFRRELAKELKIKGSSLSQKVNEFLSHGIAGHDAAPLLAGNEPVMVITDGGITYELLPPDNRKCAVEIAEIFDLPPDAKKNLAAILETLLANGNISFDRETTEREGQIAADAVQPVIKERTRGDLLIERQQIISPETVDMLQAEKAALPTGYGLGLLGNQLLLSLLLLLTGIFFLYRTYPRIFRSPYKFAICGATIILSLLANFGAIQLFYLLFSYGILPEYELLLFIMPIPFGAALTAVLRGNRVAICTGFFIASVSALMILPDRSFELALRWFAISALMSLCVRNISNYRSFFVRVFLGGALLTLLVNSDVIYSLTAENPDGVKLILLCAAANAFCCATAALLAVFAFELFFNADTTMALMVLSDMNHPLLEKMKREAPGTMFHCITVATLAEDAARAIKANPAKAKAGALFHDIGKLAMPQCFVENNIDSSKEYMKMPPQRSCGIIRGHVKEGLLLAREYRLCRFIREAIATHHGDDLISFFYRLALENSKDGNIPVLESQFRYDGKPPVGKELTIISLADACEAASRSLNKPTPAKLESLVNDIFTGRFRGEQLRNSDLSLHELNVVRECFIADLISFNHGRIAYQKEHKNDSASLPLEESETSGSEKK